MFRTAILPALGVLASLGSAALAQPGPTLYEEAVARQEEQRIIAQPIGGIRNHFWFDYRSNVNETTKELASDLRHASDTEDLRDAWDEYRLELLHERRHYAGEMAERGYTLGNVFVGQ
ncbi:MAG TPA: hypothetical protein VF491_02485 [Vicinamibacterales bacterium]